MNTQKKPRTTQLKTPETPTVDNFIQNEENKHSNRDWGKTFEELVIENEKFAYSVVYKNYSRYLWNINTKEELLSAAKAGLVYAATKYKSEQDHNNFISYAIHWICHYIREEIRKMHPVKMNQNFIVKRHKVVEFIKKYKNLHNDEIPSIEYISANTGFSEKVVNNILNVNDGEDFTFISLQSVISPGSSKNEDDGTQLENKLINEYLTSTNTSDSEFVNIELNEILETLKKHISKQDYNIFIDKYLNNMSYSEIAKKYKLNFASSASYRCRCVEKVCQSLVK